ncbi:hypothetical protein N657DRAFT_571777, partial [Parathielavia appendiculata]
RCMSCQNIGTLRVDEKSYVNRVVYQTKKRVCVEVERPEFNGDGLGPPHEGRICEGCKRGYCERR